MSRKTVILAGWCRHCLRGAALVVPQMPKRRKKWPKRCQAPSGCFGPHWRRDGLIADSTRNCLNCGAPAVIWTGHVHRPSA